MNLIRAQVRVAQIPTISTREAGSHRNRELQDASIVTEKISQRSQSGTVQNGKHNHRGTMKEDVNGGGRLEIRLAFL